MNKSRKPFADVSLLSQEDQDAIRAKARETVAKEQSEAAEKAFLEQALAEERASAGINDKNEELVDVLIDLPGFTDRITLNINRVYYQGATYKLPLSVARDLQSMMARAWEHESEVGGANRDAYRKPREQRLSPGVH